MKKLSALLFLAAVALGGCNEKDPVQTVDWYKTNAPARAAMLTKCKANPGELAASPNCINAQQAQNEKDLSRRGFLKLPPVDAGKKEE